MAKKKNKTLETEITGHIRNLLRMMRVPHFKHFGGPLSEKGVTDIIGTLPGETPPPPITQADQLLSYTKRITGRTDITMDNAAYALAEEVIQLRSRGRALWIEVKTETGKVSDDQEKFMRKMEVANGVVFVARSSREVIEKLTRAGFEPAKNIDIQFEGKQ